MKTTVDALLPQKLQDDAPDVMVIQGQAVDSKNEWYVGQALEYYKTPYTYQHPFGGGNMRGGTYIDFVIWSGKPKAVMIQGEYWHTRPGVETEDAIKEAAMTRAGYEVVYLYEDETASLAVAKKTVRERLL